MKNFKNYYDDLYLRTDLPKKDRLRITRFQKIASIINNGSKVLDYGGGDGYLESFLDKNVEYFLIDLAETHKQILKKPDHRLKFSTNGKIPVSDKFFDVVVMSEVLEHLPNVIYTLTEIKRVLKSDGILIVTVPNAYNVYYIIKVVLKLHLDPSGEHLYLFDISHLKNLFKFVGFDLISYETFAFLPGKIYSNYFYWFDFISTKILKNLNLQLIAFFRNKEGQI